jgi:hypothetical protein
MPEETPQSPMDPTERAAKRGAQVAMLAFFVLSSLFVVSSTWQLAHAVFFEPHTSASPPAASSRPAPPCASVTAGQRSPAPKP